MLTEIDEAEFGPGIDIVRILLHEGTIGGDALFEDTRLDLLALFRRVKATQKFRGLARLRPAAPARHHLFQLTRGDVPALFFYQQGAETQTRIDIRRVVVDQAAQQPLRPRLVSQHTIGRRKKETRETMARIQAQHLLEGRRRLRGLTLVELPKTFDQVQYETRGTRGRRIGRQQLDDSLIMNGGLLQITLAVVDIGEISVGETVVRLQQHHALQYRLRIVEAIEQQIGEARIQQHREVVRIFGEHRRKDLQRALDLVAAQKNGARVLKRLSLVGIEFQHRLVLGQRGRDIVLLLQLTALLHERAD